MTAANYWTGFTNLVLAFWFAWDGASWLSITGCSISAATSLAVYFTTPANRIR